MRRATTSAIIWPISAGWRGTRNWLAGERLSYADLAAAAHLSVVDYLGDVPWNEDEAAKTWYARVKSRPVVPSAAGRDAARAFRRRRPTRTWISERRGAQGRAARRRARARLRCRRRDAPGRDSAGARPASSASSPKASTATWTGSPRPRERRADPHALWPDARSVIMLGLNYGPDAIRWRFSQQRDARRDLGLRAGRRLSRPDQGQAQGASRAGSSAQAGGDVKVFVDTAAVMEKPLAAAAGLGWQGKHTNLVIARVRLVAVPRRDLHHARTAARRARDRSLRLVPRLPRHLPDRRHFRRPTGSMRGAASRTSPSSTRARSRANCAPRWATASTAATIASPSVRGTSSRRPAARRSCGAREPCARRALAELARARRCGVPRAVLQIAGQAHRPRPLHAQRADRDRQFGRCVRWRRKPSGCSTMPRRWCAARPSGRWRNFDPARFAQLSDTHRSGERDAEVLKEWIAALMANLFCFGLGYSASHYITEFGGRF